MPRFDDILGMPTVPAGQPVPPVVTMGDPLLVGALRTGPDEPLPIGREELAEAKATLTRYKAGKANLEARVVEDELWWEVRHWEAIRRRSSEKWTATPTSAWLFNTITSKHADAMDNIADPVILPREQSDEAAAKILSSVVPVVMEHCEYEQIYSDAWWEKLKHGTAVYSAHWNPKMENGLGDIEVRQIDLLNIFWEPGITDIQKSRHLFVVDLVDEDLLEEQYPEYKGKLKGDPITVKQYIYDDAVDVGDKSLVVDWYYKVERPDGKTLLHYAKFVGDVLLYASENDLDYRDRGYYDHGQYPVVFDTLFPEKGTPVGFGYIAICKDPQMYIDKMYGYILDHAERIANPRYFVSEATDMNESEFLDWSAPMVHLTGALGPDRVQRIEIPPISNIYMDIMQLKIDEMKETSSNRDVNSGGSGGTSTAAGIAALQEAGNKTSRDMIGNAYRAHVALVELVIELMRQFYTETRSFRIVDPNDAGQYSFIDMDNAMLQDQPQAALHPGAEVLYRRPVFDIKVRAQKKSPFSRMEQNERAKELYAQGFFNPEMAQPALGALKMMDFEGIDDVREFVMQGQTLQQQVQELSALLEQLTGVGMGGEETGGGPVRGGGASGTMGDRSIGRKVSDAGTGATTSYMDRMRSRARVSMDNPSRSAMPGV